ncbi:hypothetical protein RAMLITH_05200 [Ramlibacter sp. RBP-2]|uniref:Uncharacterized protein n=1 Tax=Ramlibacter lithotrophicus TaxID=2606681 RepID=A0A7X6DDL8_9BURK|nr:hypothetical protein [Ramlibacter lithotrophicus]NKE65209.1 hypothetical protein [Ramlibacter lithotrophicus]
MGQVRQDQTGSEEPRDEGAAGDFGNAGMGAASALEKMKSQHQRRHQRLHGSNAQWPERDDDARQEG